MTKYIPGLVGPAIVVKGFGTCLNPPEPKGGGTVIVVEFVPARGNDPGILIFVAIGGEADRECCDLLGSRGGVYSVGA